MCLSGAGFIQRVCGLSQKVMSVRWRGLVDELRAFGGWRPGRCIDMARYSSFLKKFNDRHRTKRETRCSLGSHLSCFYFKVLRSAEKKKASLNPKTVLPRFQSLLSDACRN